MIYANKLKFIESDSHRADTACDMCRYRRGQPNRCVFSNQIYICIILSNAFFIFFYFFNVIKSNSPCSMIWKIEREKFKDDFIPWKLDFIVFFLLIVPIIIIYYRIP